MLRDVSNPVNTNVSFLLCSVLTLIPVDNIFKKVVIKQDLFCNRTNKTFILVGLNEVHHYAKQHIKSLHLF